MHGFRRTTRVDPAKASGSRTASYALVATLWMGLGVVAGVVDYATVLRSRGVSFGQAVGGPFLASLIWIPMTFGAAAASRRWIVWPNPKFKHIVVHGILSGVSSFVLNITWGVAMARMAGTESLTSEVLSAAAFAGVRFIHLNAGVYWVIVVVVTLWNRRSNQPQQSPTERAWPRMLTIKSGTTTRSVPVSDIRWIEGAGDYARVHAKDAKFLAGERLKQLERELDPSNFARVHRSAIVRLSCIRALHHRSHGDYEVLLDDGTRVRVSRSRRATIESLLKPNGKELARSREEEGR